MTENDKESKLAGTIDAITCENEGTDVLIRLICNDASTAARITEMIKDNYNQFGVFSISVTFAKQMRH